MHNEQTGCISELKAQTYFMELGYDVFAPISKHSRADLIAVDRDTNDLLRVQVKTVQTNGEYLQARITVKDKPYTVEDTDLFIFVYEDKMWEVPVDCVEGLTSVNFGRVDEQVLNNRTKRFDTSEYQVK
ncbi:conserved hypothetical protein [Vibrio phage 468E53-1]|nr:conserved hypothetical protein [Vibrio phage 468E53-1]